MLKVHGGAVPLANPILPTVDAHSSPQLCAASVVAYMLEFSSPIMFSPTTLSSSGGSANTCRLAGAQKYDLLTSLPIIFSPLLPLAHMERMILPEKVGWPRRGLVDRLS